MWAWACGTMECACAKTMKRGRLRPPCKGVGELYDNEMAGNFFPALKTGCACRHEAAAFLEANERIDRYMYFYNYERIQSKAGMAPRQRRHSC